MSLFWDRILNSHSYCVLIVDQAFVKAYTYDLFSNEHANVLRVFVQFLTYQNQALVV